MGPDDLVDTNLTALILKAELRSSTGVLTVREGVDVALLYFVQGTLFHAVAGSDVGDAAAIDALQMRSPSFEFDPDAPVAGVQTVKSPIGRLVPMAIEADPQGKDPTSEEPVSDAMLPSLPYRATTSRSLGLMAGCLWLAFVPFSSCLLLLGPTTGPRPSLLDTLQVILVGSAACAVLIVVLGGPILYTSLTVTETRLRCWRVIGGWSLLLADVTGVEWVDRTVRSARYGGPTIVHNLVFSTSDGSTREMRTDVWIGRGLGTVMWLLSRHLPRPEAAAAAAEVAGSYFHPTNPAPASGPRPGWLGRLVALPRSRRRR